MKAMPRGANLSAVNKDKILEQNFEILWKQTSCKTVLHSLTLCEMVFLD